MRAAGAICAFTLTICRVVHATPRTVEDEIADAAAAGKPLLIEIGATWCGPCRSFAKDILPTPDVQAALEHVKFVQYDSDVAPGDAVADRYHVSAFPTFIVVDSHDGSELERVAGFSDSKGFVELLERARTGAARGASFRAAVELHPDDAGARLRLADYDRSIGESGLALEHYARAVRTPNIDPESAARATDAIAKLVTARELVARLDTDAALARREPNLPVTSKRLARLAVSRHVSRTELRQLAIAHLIHLNADRWDEVADAVRVAMLVGAIPEAISAARRSLVVSRQHPAMKLLNMEIHLYLERFGSVSLELSDVCDRPPGGFELRCYALRVAARMKQRGPGVQHLYAVTAAALRGTPVDASYDLEWLADLDSDFGERLAEAFNDASHSCNSIAHEDTFATLVLGLARTGGPPHIVMIRDTHDAALSVCLRNSLEAQWLPARPPGLETVTMPIDVAARPLASRSAAAAPAPPLPPPRPLSDGGIIFATIRAGSVATRGIGGKGIIHVAELDRARLVIEGQFEAGVSNEKEATYMARVLIGVGYMSSTSVMLSFVTGVGVSRYGGTTPAAIEMPFVLRLGFVAGGLHCSLWGQSTIFPAEKRRQLNEFGGDEVAAGLGVSIPISKVRLHLGASIEHRMAGTSAVVLVGLPIGNLF